MKTVLDTKPTKETLHGKAWQVPTTNTPYAVASWIVYAPWAHPFWAYYLLGMVSLADDPNAPPVIRYVDNATHELLVFAIAPDAPPRVDGEPGSLRLLHPKNFFGQIVATDAEAAARVEQDVDAILAGQLNPDTDAIRMWIARYGDATVKDRVR